jgi:hypothetical protein
MNIESQLRQVSQDVRKDADRLGIAISTRDSLIRDAHTDGVPMRTIAKWAGMSFQRVAQIVNA